MLRARLEKLKKRILKEDQGNDNSYSINRDSMEEDWQLWEENENEGKSIGSMLKTAYGGKFQNRNKGIIIREAESKKIPKETQKNEEEARRILQTQRASENKMTEEIQRINQKEGTFKARPPNMYIIEMPEESDDSIEQNQQGEDQSDSQKRKKELVLYLESALQLKKKCHEMEMKLRHEDQEDKKSVQKIASSHKKKKELSQNQKAEEAGLYMPQQKK
ncbi:hypothetical protein PIB30_022144 [Stylosanthes scabra]|uniref:Uncharacterized protein n=1 Tax=Stylosanthes scabra TaxID=79078 RepID=A0ABU6U8G5_9FABA|nr:hypothetical protein [Stylosanthes scabra]